MEYKKMWLNYILIMLTYAETTEVSDDTSAELTF
jgi:hypothetical protein